MEIERKFRVPLGTFPVPRETIIIDQWYLRAEDGEEIRIRFVSGVNVPRMAYLQRKVDTDTPMVRVEESVEIPVSYANILVKGVEGEKPLIIKQRFTQSVPDVCGVVYEATVDVFLFPAYRFQLIEVEFEDQKSALLFDPPRAWQEVTDDPDYRNINLARYSPSTS